MNDSRKKKRIVWFSILAVVILVLLAGVLFYIFKPDKGSQLDTVQVNKGTVIQTLDKTATVAADDVGDFTLVDGVVVKTVNVSVGQLVKKGEVLATFDTSSFNEAVNEKLEIYNQVKAKYDEYNSSTSSATGQLSAVNSQISKIEARIAELEKIIEKQKNEDVTENATTEEKTELDNLKKALTKLIDDTVLSSRLIQLILKNSESAQQAIDALKSVINSMGSSTGKVDIEEITEKFTISDEQKELISLQLELSELKMKQATLSLKADDSLASLYKKIAESAYDAYLSAKTSAAAVSTGWVAEADGIVSSVSIKEGDVFDSGSGAGSSDISSMINSVISGNLDMSALLSTVNSKPATGLTVQYFPLSAKFMLGKTEISKVSVGQKVDVMTIGGEKITGTVVHKGAIASTGNALDITSVLGGGTSSAGVDVLVEIDEYNEDVIIGMDVEISIKTAEVNDAVTVPIESVQYENSQAYVFVYDAEEGCVRKTVVTIGLRDDTTYQILSGCNAGDIIVKSPTSTLEDGEKIQSNLVTKK